MTLLTREFYSQNTEHVAKALLGCTLVHRINNLEYSGRIVETEAYLGSHDLASHPSKGITKRSATMFGPPGHAYIYLIYGMYHCFNIVTEPEGIGTAVLIRALEPIANITLNTKGPGLLCKAMQITKAQNGLDLVSNNLFVQNDGYEVEHIVAKPRIGVAYAKDWAQRPLRFYIRDNPFVSKP